MRFADCHEDKKHFAKGLCKACYRADFYSKNKPLERDRAKSYRQKYYRENKEACLELSKLWYQGNKEHHKKKCREFSLKRNFGLTSEGYEELLKKQENKCAICDRLRSNLTVDLCVDHDHVTGKIRGLLCSRCNRALGALGDSKEGIQKVLEYLES